VDKAEIGAIDAGYLVLLGVAKGDTGSDVDFIIGKVRDLRLFPGPGGDFDLPVRDAGGRILIVSQFTLLGECGKGRRPDWGAAAGAGEAEPLYRAVIDGLRDEGLDVREGRFGARMAVNLVNDGPVTILLDSGKAENRK